MSWFLVLVKYCFVKQFTQTGIWFQTDFAEDKQQLKILNIEYNCTCLITPLGGHLYVGTLLSVMLQVEHTPLIHAFLD